MSDEVLVAVDDHVCTISLNRPHRHNAFDDAMYDQLNRATADAVADPAVRVILLRGEGPSFSSGRDTAVLGDHSSLGSVRFGMRAQEVNTRLAQSATPVIAALRGHVLGKALETALVCDMRIAATDVSIALPEVRFGLITDNGGAAMAALLAGPSRAKYLLMTGAPIAAEQALAWGLVDLVVSPEELDGRAASLAQAIARQPPLAVTMAKQAVDRGHLGQLLAAMQAELLSDLALASTDDYQEAKTARREQRDPHFTGR